MTKEQIEQLAEKTYPIILGEWQDNYRERWAFVAGYTAALSQSPVWVDEPITAQILADMGFEHNHSNWFSRDIDSCKLIVNPELNIIDVEDWSGAHTVRLWHRQESISIIQVNNILKSLSLTTH